MLEGVREYTKKEMEMIKEFRKKNKVKKLDSKDFSKEYSGQKMFIKGY